MPATVCQQNHGCQVNVLNYYGSLNLKYHGTYKRVCIFRIAVLLLTVPNTLHLAIFSTLHLAPCTLHIFYLANFHLAPCTLHLALFSPYFAIICRQENTTPIRVPLPSCEVQDNTSAFFFTDNEHHKTWHIYLCINQLCVQYNLWILHFNNTSIYNTMYNHLNNVPVITIGIRWRKEKWVRPTFWALLNTSVKWKTNWENLCNFSIFRYLRGSF